MARFASLRLRVGRCVVFTVLLVSALPVFQPLWAKARPTPTPAADDGERTTAGELFQKAQTAFREKRYSDARDILTDLVARHPLEGFIPQAKLLLANLEQDYQASLDKFKALAAEYMGRPEGEEALRNMGNRYFAADRYFEAAGVYRQFLEKYPKSPFAPEVRFFYASSLLAQNDNEEAVKQFERTAKEAPETPWAPKALLGSGTAALKMKEAEKARKTFLKILDRYPLFEESNLVYYRLAQAFEMLGRPREAHAAYTTLLSKYPKALEAGESRARMRELEKADPSLAASAGEEPPEEPVTPIVAVREQPTEGGPVEAAASSEPFCVQVGVFTQKKNAELLKTKCAQAGYEAVVTTFRTEDMPYPYYKVRIGRYATRPDAKGAAEKIAKKLKQPAIVVED